MTSARVLPMRPSLPAADLLPDGTDADAAALVARIRAGDQAAFEVVFQAYTRQLCAFAYRYVGSHETAAELVQDVFLWIWRQRMSWEVRGTLRSYLYRAVRNRALDVVRHQAIERRWAETAEAEHRHGASLGRGAASPDRVLEEKMLDSALNVALADVPERRRQIFLLRWKHGLSYAEIGAQLAISQKTVENQVARVLRFLRCRLGPGGR